MKRCLSSLAIMAALVSPTGVRAAITYLTNELGNICIQNTTCMFAQLAVGISLSSTNVCRGTQISSALSTTWIVGTNIMIVESESKRMLTYCLGHTNTFEGAVLSNKYVVTGPWSGSGNSSSVAFTPTNGGNGTIQFTSYWLNGCDTNVQTSTISTNYHVTECGLCATNISDFEWTWGFATKYPNLIRCHTCKLGDATPQGAPEDYPWVNVSWNCVGYVLNNHKWIWMEFDTDQDLKVSASEMTFALNYIGVPSGSIAYYGPSTNQLDHIAFKTGGSGNDCKAHGKPGASIALSHDLHEFEGGDSGNIVGGN